MELLKKELGGVSGDVLPGEVAFKLYDTYGFPVDSTADVARELNMSVDQAGFDEAMEAQRARGRAATSFSTSLGQKISVKEKVQFCGYEQLVNKASVLAVFDDEGEPLEQLDADQSQGVIVLDQTAFYAESGGQVGDRGICQRDCAFPGGRYPNQRRSVPAYWRSARGNDSCWRYFACRGGYHDA